MTHFLTQIFNFSISFSDKNVLSFLRCKVTKKDFYCSDIDFRLKKCDFVYKNKYINVKFVTLLLYI